MRIEVDCVAFAEVAKSASARGRATAVALAALLLSACSSGNPDSLIGMNVDENLAMTNASETPDANLAAANSSGASNSPADSRLSNQSTQPAGKGSVARASASSSTEVNAADSVATNRPSEDETTDQARDEPNAT